MIAIGLLAVVAHAGGGPTPTTDAPQYSNKILDRSYANPYTEVCFKNGFELNDFHSAGGSTVGGNCAAGDIGFVIETTPHADETWANAMAVCLSEGMRLAEPFEIQYACSNATTIGFALQTNVKGWVGNRPVVDNNTSLQYDSQKAFVLETNCNNGGWYSTYVNWTKPFLCVQ